MLQIQHICKEYRTGNLVQKALDDVSLNLRDNEFVAILGPSGSGKTTLLNIIGIELGGALKNVIALAAGTVDGLGYGDNTKAALMTRGIAELTRLGEAMGGKPETFSGLTGVGDLIVTCTSVHSRNRKAGYLMGKGMTADEAMKEVKMVVEGVYSAKAALGLAKKCNVSVPIVEAVNRVLFENADPKEEVSNLLLRERKQEHTNLEWD